MSTGRQSGQPKIFLSHSHRDRRTVTQLQELLESNSAETFLDQDQMQAGEDLTDRIREGISWCDVFLLCWSSSAASSVWVEKEWELAYDQRKKIIPYMLDNSLLPPVLENLIWVPVDDPEHGNPELLKAVFGREYRPDPTTLFPGAWYATVETSGVQATYNFELRANGQLEGDVGIDMNYGLGMLLDQLMSDAGGLEETAGGRPSFFGTWSYDQERQVLTLDISVRAGFLPQNNEIVKVHTTGKEKGSIRGRDLNGNVWILHRVN